MHLINETFSRPTNLPEAMRTVRRHMEVTCVWIRVVPPRPSRCVWVIIADEMYILYYQRRNLDEKHFTLPSEHVA